jgi:acetyl esterase/lipase
MDNSQYGTGPSKEWQAFAAKDPEMDRDGLHDTMPPVELRESANKARAAASKEQLADDGLLSKVSITTYDIPTRDGNSISMRSYRPVSQPIDKALPTYLHFHGGGMLIGTLDGEDYTCAALLSRLGENYTVLHVCYRHTPEWTFPTQTNDAWDAFEWIHAHAAELGVDGSRLAVGGASAGGCLTSSVVFRDISLAKAESRPPRVAGQILAIPWLIAREAYPFSMFVDAQKSSFHQCAQAPILPKPRYDMFSDLMKVADPHDPIINVGLASEDDLKGTPRTAYIVCGWDMLRDEAFIHAAKLERLGVPTKKHIFPGLPHFFRKHRDMPSSKRWDELMAASVLWCLEGTAEGHAAGDWQVELPEEYQ